MGGSKGEGFYDNTHSKKQVDKKLTTNTQYICMGGSKVKGAGGTDPFRYTQVAVCFLRSSGTELLVLAHRIRISEILH